MASTYDLSLEHDRCYHVTSSHLMLRYSNTGYVLKTIRGYVCSVYHCIDLTRVLGGGGGGGGVFSVHFLLMCAIRHLVTVLLLYWIGITLLYSVHVCLYHQSAYQVMS